MREIHIVVQLDQRDQPVALSCHWLCDVSDMFEPYDQVMASI